MTDATEMTIGRASYFKRPFTSSAGHDWVRMQDGHRVIVGQEVHGLVDEIERLRAALQQIVEPGGTGPYDSNAIRFHAAAALNPETPQ